MTNPMGVLDFLAWDHDWNQHHYTLEKVSRSARLMQEAGVGMVRMDFLWSDLEPSQGEFNFPPYDRRVDLLAGHHLKILGLLHYNPLWRPGPWFQAPDEADFARYAAAVVRHFRGRVSDWEIWNEPDHPTYWQPQDGLLAYSRLLKALYPVLKREDPGCRVVMGGLSRAVPDSLRQVYAQAGRGSFDIVNTHPFVSPAGGHALQDLRRMYDDTRRIMTQFDDGQKPIWFTETGCPGVPDGTASADWWMGKNPTEAQQADWVVELYTEALRWEGVDKIFWAFFRDTSAHFHDGTDYRGLLRNDFSPKPAYRAYQKIAAALQPT